MGNKIDYRVAAYITAYQDREALEQTVTAIQRQSYPIEQIFIVDNSKTELLDDNRYKNAIVDFHPENIGVAGGLKIGINWAIEKGYDFLWLFDQDSEPGSDVLEKLLHKHQELSEQGEQIGIIAPEIFDVNTKQEFPGLVLKLYEFEPVPGYSEIKDFYRCDVVITSGSLVNLNAAKFVEPPQEEFFLDVVDYAYCMNFRNKGYEIIVLKTTTMKHRLGNYLKVKDRLIKGKNNEVIVNICSPFRYYYVCRNHTFFETRTVKKVMLCRSVRHRLSQLKYTISRILRYEPDFVFLKIWASIIGTIDGFSGKLGKTW